MTRNMERMHQQSGREMEVDLIRRVHVSRGKTPKGFLQETKTRLITNLEEPGRRGKVTQGNSHYSDQHRAITDRNPQ